MVEGPFKKMLKSDNAVIALWADGVEKFSYKLPAEYAQVYTEHEGQEYTRIWEDFIHMDIVLNVQTSVDTPQSIKGYVKVIESYPGEVRRHREPSRIYPISTRDDEVLFAVDGEHSKRKFDKDIKIIVGRYD